jgi:predicted nucleic acid-binding protein
VRYLDANIFIRGLTQDEPGMSRAALELFQRIEDGHEDVAVLDATVAEVVYVLGSTSLYNQSRVTIRDALTQLLVYRNVRMDNKPRCLRALDTYAAISSAKFADALVASAAIEEPEHQVYSFDRGFDWIAGITRVEP